MACFVKIILNTHPKPNGWAGSIILKNTANFIQLKAFFFWNISQACFVSMEIIWSQALKQTKTRFIMYTYILK